MDHFVYLCVLNFFFRSFDQSCPPFTLIRLLNNMPIVYSDFTHLNVYQRECLDLCLPKRNLLHSSSCGLNFEVISDLNDKARVHFCIDSSSIFLVAKLIVCLLVGCLVACCPLRSGMRRRRSCVLFKSPLLPPPPPHYSIIVSNNLNTLSGLEQYCNYCAVMTSRSI